MSNISIAAFVQEDSSMWSFESRVVGGCWSLDCHSLFNPVSVIIFSLIIFLWQLIAFYYMHHTSNVRRSPHPDTHTHFKERCLLTSDSCVRLRITTPCWVSARGNRERERLISHAVWGGREGGEGQQWNSLIPAICHSKLLLFFQPDRT